MSRVSGVNMVSNGLLLELNKILSEKFNIHLNDNELRSFAEFLIIYFSQMLGVDNE